MFSTFSTNTKEATTATAQYYDRGSQQSIEDLYTLFVFFSIQKWT
jgi:hypothetical protein